MAQADACAKKGDNFPAVILITGSGAQNRNEEVFGHKPFLVISDYLTRNGIAVLRYDDRGTAQSTGNFRSATTADFVTDAESAFLYLQTRKEINKSKIGLIGHSEGGIIAPIIASKNRNIDFIVMLAGSGMQGYKLMLLQKEELDKKRKLSDSAIANGQNIYKGAYKIIIDSSPIDTSLKNKVEIYFKQQYEKNSDKFIDAVTNQIVNPWWVYFLKLNPIPFLEKVKCPVLALNGGNDLQVPAKENLEAIENALKKGGNKNVTIKGFPGLNHLFQKSKTGLPNEYSVIEETFSKEVLDEITKWIRQQVD